jgi:hypothetical protein
VKRRRRGDRDTVDALAAKLIEADQAAVRLSCRVADWLGKSDLVSLKPFFVGRADKRAGIYNRAIYAKEMREAMERWANHVEGITADPISAKPGRR